MVGLSQLVTITILKPRKTRKSERIDCDIWCS
ncbi:hypothetical protein NTHI1209_00294 [Haemophilus influenzae]|uniref:Uncharacterized protein n=1 Tax=Haemophilus influenzae TaxID=727 RepID=A0A158SUZ8_HAEIF|nr:hypothetical protein NTHI1209_00294 [Haemophilus influenzae]